MVPRPFLSDAMTSWSILHRQKTSDDFVAAADRQVQTMMHQR